MLEVTKAVTPLTENDLRTTLDMEIKFLIPADSAAQLLATNLLKSTLSGKFHLNVRIPQTYKKSDQ